MSHSDEISPIKKKVALGLGSSSLLLPSKLQKYTQFWQYFFLLKLFTYASKHMFISCWLPIKRIHFKAMPYFWNKDYPHGRAH
jgi:hypothetical protein